MMVVVWPPLTRLCANNKLPPTSNLYAMSFVHLGGEDGSRPTYFEVLAADRLVPSLRAAVVYVMSVRQAVM